MDEKGKERKKFSLPAPAETGGRWSGTMKLSCEKDPVSAGSIPSSPTPFFSRSEARQSDGGISDLCVVVGEHRGKESPMEEPFFGNYGLSSGDHRPGSDGETKENSALGPENRENMQKIPKRIRSIFREKCRNGRKMIRPFRIRFRNGWKIPGTESSKTGKRTVSLRKKENIPPNP